MNIRTGTPRRWTRYDGKAYLCEETGRLCFAALSSTRLRLLGLRANRSSTAMPRQVAELLTQWKSGDPTVAHSTRDRDAIRRCSSQATRPRSNPA